MIPRSRPLLASNLMSPAMQWPFYGCPTAIIHVISLPCFLIPLALRASLSSQLPRSHSRLPLTFSHHPPPDPICCQLLWSLPSQHFACKPHCLLWHSCHPGASHHLTTTSPGLLQQPAVQFPCLNSLPSLIYLPLNYQTDLHKVQVWNMLPPIFNQFQQLPIDSRIKYKIPFDRQSPAQPAPHPIPIFLLFLHSSTPYSATKWHWPSCSLNYSVHLPNLNIFTGCPHSWNFLMPHFPSPDFSDFKSQLKLHLLQKAFPNHP